MSVTDEEVLDLLHKLQRPGSALPRRLDSLWSSLLYALAGEFARVFNAIAAFEVELDPFQTHELLPNFEGSLLLPGCIPLSATEELRRQAVLFLLRRANRNLTGAQIEETALAFGFVVVVTEYDPATVCGEAVCGGPLIPETAAYFFEVSSAEFEEVDAFHGAAVYGDTLGLIAGDELQCLINQIRPLHKTPVFVTT